MFEHGFHPQLPATTRHLRKGTTPLQRMDRSAPVRATIGRYALRPRHAAPRMPGMPARKVIAAGHIHAAATGYDFAFVRVVP